VIAGVDYAMHNAVGSLNYRSDDDEGMSSAYIEDHTSMLLAANQQ